MAGPRVDGPGPSPSGTAGATTVVGGGSLTSTALVTGGGGSSLQTPSATTTLDSSGNLQVAGGTTFLGEPIIANGISLGFGANTRIFSDGSGLLRLRTFGSTTFNRLQFGGTTSSFCALGSSTTVLTAQLADGTSGGSFNASGALLNTGITSDATHTDSTVCQDTTTHQFYAGSGAVGICLGTSSARYKKGIKQLKSGLSAVLGLNPISYRYRKGFGTNNKNLYGFTAEDMIDILPELVGLDADGAPNSVDMVGLLPVLVNAIKDLAAQNDLLNTRLNTLLDAR